MMSDIPLKLINFMTSESDRLERFVGLSGLGADDLKAGLVDPVFHAFLLDYLLHDETLLLCFAAEADISPQAILRLRHSLPGFSE
jgi:Protein of unknown function (DUF3572)